MFDIHYVLCLLTEFFCLSMPTHDQIHKKPDRERKVHSSNSTLPGKDRLSSRTSDANPDGDEEVTRGTAFYDSD